VANPCVKCNAAFKPHSGSRPKSFFKTRVLAALRLLEETSLSATEIGLACGFVDASGFTQHFRKRIGLSPGSYRARFLRGSGYDSTPLALLLFHPGCDRWEQIVHRIGNDKVAGLGNFAEQINERIQNRNPLRSSRLKMTTGLPAIERFFWCL